MLGGALDWQSRAEQCDAKQRMGKAEQSSARPSSGLAVSGLRSEALE